MIRQRILQLAEIDFVRSAIEERADLSAFKGRPSLRVLVGVSAIVLSYVIGWPAVAVIGFFSVRLHEPWLATIGCPLVYGLSHIVFLLGMYLAGATYSMIFLRWLTRVSMEKLLSWTGRPSNIR
jgi:hypothetical protein